MHIQQEPPDLHSIQAYSESEIKINSIIYSQSLIVNREQIILDLKVHSIIDLNEILLESILKMQPEVVIIGHCEPGILPHQSILALLSQHRIGMECMSIGAASRTYNVLLSEERAVVAGFILPRV